MKLFAKSISQFTSAIGLIAVAVVFVLPARSFADKAPRSQRCEQFIQSLSAYASGANGKPTENIVTTWRIVRNESLLELSKFYGVVRQRFSQYDCRVHEDFSQFWPLFVSGHLNSPDALEPTNVRYTNRLITLAFRAGDARAIGEIADVYGHYLLKNYDWTAALVRSPQIASVLMERLWLLSEEWKDIKLRAEAMSTLNRRAPGLLPLYHALARSRNSLEYMRQVPSEARAKSKYVHQAVRSSLKHFLNLQPSANQIRQLALWMHDYNELFHIQTSALQRVRTASEFLRVTDYYYQPVPEEYAELVRKFLRPKYNAFLTLSPSSLELVEFSKRTQDAGSSGDVLTTALKEAKTAAEFISVVEANADHGANEFAKLLQGFVQRFSQLEPSADEINRFRILLGKGNAELQLLRFTLPKMVSGADFLTLARLHGKDQERRGDEFSMGVRAILREHIDMFLAVSPTVDEINSYRQRTMDVETDGKLLEAAIRNASSAREILLAATLFGLEPPHSPTAFDEVATKVLVAHADAFIAKKPSLNEVQVYRARMANPYADLKLVNYALSVVTNRNEVFNVIARRPMLHTQPFQKRWSETLERHWPRLKNFMTTKDDAALFLREVPDRSVVDRIKASR